MQRGLDFLKNVNSKFVGLPPHRISANLRDFIAANADIETPDVYFLWLFYTVSFAMGAEIPLKPADKVGTMMVETGDGDAEVTIFRLPDDIRPTQKRGFVDPEQAQILSTNAQPMAALVLQLVGCMQVKPLKMANLKGYHASSGSLAPFSGELEALRYVSSCMEGVSGNERIRELRLAKKFLMYHTTATSTPGLVIEAHESMPDFMKPLISDQDIRFAEDAKAAYDSLEAASRISSRAVAAAYLWFEATGQDRGGEKWYQGKKAVDELPPHMLIKLRAAMKLYIKEQKATDDDATAQDIIQSLGINVD